MIQVEDKQERAYYLGLAAILGDDIYNFGELVSKYLICLISIIVLKTGTVFCFNFS